MTLIPTTGLDGQYIAKYVHRLLALRDNPEELARYRTLVYEDERFLDQLAGYTGINEPEHVPGAKELCFGKEYGPLPRTSAD